MSAEEPRPHLRIVHGQPSAEEIAAVVADRLNKVEGVNETETHIAFRTYSRHDLESAFSIGLD